MLHIKSILNRRSLWNFQTSKRGSFASFSFPFLIILTISFGICAIESVEDIDKELKSLQEELSVARKNSFNKEMEAQNLMFDNLKEYSQDLQMEERDEKRVLEIKKKINKLMDERRALIENGNK